MGFWRFFFLDFLLVGVSIWRGGLAWAGFYVGFGFWGLVLVLVLVLEGRGGAGVMDWGGWMEDGFS